MRLVLSVAFFVLFTACKNEDDKLILPPQKMEAVLFDFVMADAHTNLNVKVDSVVLAQKENVKLQKRIFSIHGITREQFKESFDYYTKRPAEFTIILDSITAKENRRNVAPTMIKYE